MAKFVHEINVEGTDQPNVLVEVTEGDTLADVSIGSGDAVNLNAAEVATLIATLQAAQATIELNR